VPGITQCAADSTRSGAIRAPLQNVPREPMMVTTERPTPSSVAGAPPTMADAGRTAVTMGGATNSTNVSKAIRRERWIIGESRPSQDR
jgi:hypothetical protein